MTTLSCFFFKLNFGKSIAFVNVKLSKRTIGDDHLFLKEEGSSFRKQRKLTDCVIVCGVEKAIKFRIGMSLGFNSKFKCT